MHNESGNYKMSISISIYNLFRQKEDRPPHCGQDGLSDQETAESSISFRRCS